MAVTCGVSRPRAIQNPAYRPAGTFGLLGFCPTSRAVLGSAGHPAPADRLHRARSGLAAALRQLGFAKAGERRKAPGPQHTLNLKRALLRSPQRPRAAASSLTPIGSHAIPHHPVQSRCPPNDWSFRRLASPRTRHGETCGSGECREQRGFWTALSRTSRTGWTPRVAYRFLRLSGPCWRETASKACTSIRPFIRKRSTAAVTPC